MTPLPTKRPFRPPHLPLSLIDGTLLDDLIPHLPQRIQRLLVLLSPHDALLRKQLAQALLHRAHQLHAAHRALQISCDPRPLVDGESKRVLRAANPRERVPPRLQLGRASEIGRLAVDDDVAREQQELEARGVLEFERAIEARGLLVDQSLVESAERLPQEQGFCFSLRAGVELRQVLWQAGSLKALDGRSLVVDDVGLPGLVVERG